MKRQLLTVMMTVALGALAATAISAQTSRITADVPFAFQINGATYPAGAYALDFGGPAGPMVRLTNVDRSSSIVFLTNNSYNLKPIPPSLQFNRYGNVYFLSNIVGPDRYSGKELRKSAAEREAMAGVPVHAETVVARK